MPTTTTIDAFDVLGLHPVRGRADAFDGFDLALRLSSGDICAYGVRTANLVLAGGPNDSDGWLAGYTPIRVEFEPAAVRFWDFDEPMWIGPEPRPCLVWSNAEFFTQTGIGYLVRAGNFAKILAGRDGAGLPLLADLAAEQEHRKT
jgi:hypothetical protein